MGQSNTAASRYSLILETISGKKYYFNANEGVFVLLYEGNRVAKTSLPALDFLTANFANKEELGLFYGIDEKVNRVYITYNFEGEKQLAPVFNNSEWAHVASTTAVNKGVDFQDKDNLALYNEVYSEIADLDSEFADMLLRNKNRLINLSPKTRDTIVCLRAHENAIKMKKTYGFQSSDYQTNMRVSQVYSEDQYGFYQDLKKRLSKYREFRTVYMNYCKFTNAKRNTTTQTVDKPMRKVMVPPQQISMFDKMENE